MKKQLSSGTWKPSRRCWLWLALYLPFANRVGGEFTGSICAESAAGCPAGLSTVLALGALAVVLALDLQAFLVSRECWAVAGQMLVTIAAQACLSLLAGNSALEAWLSVALIGLGILASLGLLATRLLWRRQ